MNEQLKENIKQFNRAVEMKMNARKAFYVIFSDYPSEEFVHMLVRDYWREFTVESIKKMMDLNRKSLVG